MKIYDKIMFGIIFISLIVLSFGCNPALLPIETEAIELVEDVVEYELKNSELSPQKTEEAVIKALDKSHVYD